MSEAEQIVPGWSPATTYQPGGFITQIVTKRRKWWQLWKPREEQIVRAWLAADEPQTEE